jgi:hypothetical protein
MRNMANKDVTPEAGSFAEWRQGLEADELLSPGLRESFRRVPEGFEQFCLKRAAAPARTAGVEADAPPTVRLAREYVELQRLERAPGPAQLQEWKDALNWLFRCGRGQRRAALMDVPPLGRADLGRTPWERRLVETIRVRHLSWRTEHEQEGDAPCAAAFLCDAFAGARHGNPDSAGTAGPRGCGDEADLHPCDAQAGAGGAQSVGLLVPQWAVGGFPVFEGLDVERRTSNLEPGTRKGGPVLE